MVGLEIMDLIEESQCIEDINRSIQSDGNLDHVMIDSDVDNARYLMPDV